jgi:hypothetical protein
MKQYLILFFLGMTYTGTCLATEPTKPDFQRYDLVRESSELTLETTNNLWMEQNNSADLYTLRLGVHAEYTFKTNHSISLKLPYTLAWYNNPDARTTLFYSLGDLSLGYEYLKQMKHINLFVGPLITIPLAETNEYAAREGVYSTSNGRVMAGFSLAITGIRDPVVWNAGVQYLVGLPKEERSYWSWQPGDIQVSLGVSDLVNNRFGFALGLYHHITLPDGKGEHWELADLAVSTFARVEGLLVFEQDYMRVSVDAYVYPLNKPVVLGITYGHQFDLSKKRDR